MTHAATIDAALREAAGRLRGRSDSPRLDAELLLAKLLGRSRTALVTAGDALLDADQLRRFDGLLDQRGRGVPVAYLTGTREFWSLPLRVTPDVLVPRPETEDLVEQVLARLPVDGDPRVLELGTGSGAIALAIASERPRARVTATDLSAAALAVAAGNAAALGLGNIDWRQGCWYAAVAGQLFDVIVSNPPYVAAGDSALESLRHEPLLALTPGEAGLEAFDAIIAGAPAHLRAGGLVALEHGLGQFDAIAERLRAQGFAGIASRPDRAGIARVALATFRPTT